MGLIDSGALLFRGNPAVVDRLKRVSAFDRHYLAHEFFTQEEASKRLHSNVLVVALAAKLARMAWSMLAKGRDYDANSLGRAIRYTTDLI
jgi:hypothetical protein